MMSGWEAKEPQMTQSTCQACVGRVIAQQSINIDPTAALPTLVHSGRSTLLYQSSMFWAKRSA